MCQRQGEDDLPVLYGLASSPGLTMKLQSTMTRTQVSLPALSAHTGYLNIDLFCTES